MPFIQFQKLHQIPAPSKSSLQINSVAKIYMGLILTNEEIFDFDLLKGGGGGGGGGWEVVQAYNLENFDIEIRIEGEGQDTS